VDSSAQVMANFNFFRMMLCIAVPGDVNVAHVSTISAITVDDSTTGTSCGRFLVIVYDVLASPRRSIAQTGAWVCPGKTTLLRELLSQSKYKIGCIVNDVAAVNIDAKLVRNQTNKTGSQTTTSDLAPTIELQNGCACVHLLLILASISEKTFDPHNPCMTVSRLQAARSRMNYSCRLSRFWE
jgi:hypothetical protein